jgi:hypothetical protein
LPQVPNDLPGLAGHLGTHTPSQCPVRSRVSHGCGQLQAGVHAPSHGVPVAPPSHSSV